MTTLGMWPRALACVFAADFACALTLWFAVHGWSVDASDLVSAAVFHFSSDTVELLWLSAARVLLSTLLALAGIKYGTAETVRERALRERQAVLASIATSDSSYASVNQADCGSGGGMKGSLGVWSPSSSKRRTAVGTYGATSSTEPLLSVAGGVSISASSHASSLPLPTSEEDQAKLDFAGLSKDELQEQIALVQSARARRRIAFVALFAWLQGQSFYSGVKLVDFQFSALCGVHVQAALMGALIALINVEHVLIQYIITVASDPAGLKMPSLHHHELHFDDSVAGHWCDLCSDRIAGVGTRV